MRSASGLTLIAIGAILAFAVTTNTPVFNLHIAGWVLIVIGLVGILMPKKSYGWLRRKMVLRPGPRGPVVSRLDETHYPRSIVRFPDDRPSQDDRTGGQSWLRRGWVQRSPDPFRRQVRAETTIQQPMAGDAAETIEEFTEE